jgi:lipid-A-disaccharide synthase
LASRLPQIDLFIIAGEPSGDLHGAALIGKLLQLNPNLRIHAVAGPHMRKYPIHCVENMEKLAVMGFTDVIAALPKIARLFFSLRKKIVQSKAKAVITIDYPGFNLRLQNSLRKQKIPSQQIHYICPTVWAWGKKRIKLMARTLDLGLCILPFEPACFTDTALKMEYVGHPLVSAISHHKPDPNFRTRYSLLPSNKILSLFAGSRQKEIDRNLPLMLEAAAELQKKDPSLRIINSHDVAREEIYDLMRNSHLALAKSGTVTLELALHKIPTIIQYAIKPFDVFLATKVFKIKLPYYGLPNVILQEEVFPELFGPKLTPSSLLELAKNLWFDEEKRALCQEGCDKLWSILQQRDASLEAAEQILQCITREKLEK